MSSMSLILPAGPRRKSWSDSRDLAYILTFIKVLIQHVEAASSTTRAPSSNEDTDEVLSKAMLIGLCVGFGSLLGVIIICCICFKCCDCSNDGTRNRVTSSKRRIAWK